MGDKRTPQDEQRDKVIEAFDRERARAQELNRRHTEQVRVTREQDKAVFIERRRLPR